MMSTMNYNFDRLFLTDDSRGGWDVIVEENPNNPIADLAAAARRGRSSTPRRHRFARVGRAEPPAAAEASRVPQSPHAPIGELRGLPGPRR